MPKASQRPVHPPALHPDLARARFVAHLLDEAFVVPGTKYRVGIDALIGIIPGIGDLIGGILSLYIIGVAIQLGLPKPTILRMVFNVLIEVVGGTVPVLGDLFDAGWKANLRNVRLAEGAIAAAAPRRWLDLGFLLTVVVLVLAILTAAAAASAWILICLWDWIRGSV